MEKQNTYANAYKAQQLMERAEGLAIERMSAHGYVDPRLAGLIKGSLDDLDRCREYDQKLAYFRHVVIKELQNETRVNVKPHNDWASKAYG
jgi:hypothetical protein